jgi:nitroimidazol reductase NimA-like FMN-containing flavoprotein (pyridoxamine 5'-phosphate oxidase superfamily)
MSMSDPVVGEILGRAMVARIATVSRRQRPHVNPLYFVVIDGRIHLGTATYTLATHNVGANRDVQILFEVESAPTDRRILKLDGTAVVRTETEMLRRYRRAVARKYILTRRGIWNMLTHPRQWVPMRRHLRGGAACVIDVTPTATELLVAQATAR